MHYTSAREQTDFINDVPRFNGVAFGVEGAPGQLKFWRSVSVAINLRCENCAFLLILLLHTATK
jgi:hypothetical protein